MLPQHGLLGSEVRALELYRTENATGPILGAQTKGPCNYPKTVSPGCLSPHLGGLQLCSWSVAASGSCHQGASSRSVATKKASAQFTRGLEARG